MPKICGEKSAETDAETRDNIARNLEVVHSIKESIELNLSGEKSYEIFECQPRQDLLEHHVEILCDQLVKKRNNINRNHSSGENGSLGLQLYR